MLSGWAPVSSQQYQATIGKGAGARRWHLPVYVDHLPPCNHACPAGENIQAWLALAQSGDDEQAWQKYTPSRAMGVKIVRNTRVTDVQAEKAAGSFAAVFLGIGAQVAAVLLRAQYVAANTGYLPGKLVQ